MPVLLQALLRQKIQEIKRLEIALQNEQHLRSELELDFEDRGNIMKDKGKHTFIFCLCGFGDALFWICLKNGWHTIVIIFSQTKHVFGTQKNRLNETILLSTHKMWFGSEILALLI